MISNSSKYAIRAVLYLAIHSSESNKYSPQQIAEEINIPAPFLAKTLQQLSKYKIISSTKGRNGGFYLTNLDKEGSVISIVKCIDGFNKLKGCFLSLPTCSDENPCAIHHLAAPLRNNLIKELSQRSIGEFAHTTIEEKEYFLFYKRTAATI